MNKPYNFKFIRGKELEYAIFKKNACRRCTNKECSRDIKTISNCLNKGNFASKTEQLKEQLKNIEPFNTKIQRYISTAYEQEQREKSYIRLTELLSEYFRIGTDNCITYNLVTEDDLVQFDMKIIDDIVHFLIKKGVQIGER